MHSPEPLLVSAVILVWLMLSELGVTKSGQVGRETYEKPSLAYWF